MTKKDLVVKTLESMGYKPKIDDDGDVMFHYQMKLIYILGTQMEDKNYLVVMFPQFSKIKEGEEIKTLTVCNKLSRDITLTKVYIDNTLENVSASCEFFYCDEECLAMQLDESLRRIGQIRSTYKKLMTEFDE